MTMARSPSPSLSVPASDKKGPWSPEEDELLKEAYIKDDPRARWGEIAKSVPGRCAKQCRERWEQNLNPSLKKTPIEDAEAVFIIERYEQIGAKWANICRDLERANFGLRSDNCVKNWYHGMCAKGKSGKHSSHNPAIHMHFTPEHQEGLKQRFAAQPGPLVARTAYMARPGYHPYAAATGAQPSPVSRQSLPHLPHQAYSSYENAYPHHPAAQYAHQQQVYATSPYQAGYHPHSPAAISTHGTKLAPINTNLLPPSPPQSLQAPSPHQQASQYPPPPHSAPYRYSPSSLHGSPESNTLPRLELGHEQRQAYYHSQASPSRITPIDTGSANSSYYSRQSNYSSHSPATTQHALPSPAQSYPGSSHSREITPAESSPKTPNQPAQPLARSPKNEDARQRMSITNIISS